MWINRPKFGMELTHEISTSLKIQPLILCFVLEVSATITITILNPTPSSRSFGRLRRLRCDALLTHC